MRKVFRLLLAVATVAAGLAITVGAATPAGAAVPAGFSDDLVTAVGGPTSLDFTPDGRMLITAQSGSVRVVENNALLPTPAVNLSSKLCSNSERGLLGVAVDPAFAHQRLCVPLLLVQEGGDCGASTVNRVARFVMPGNTLGGEVVLIDNIPSPAGNHNAGDLQFGKDGLLYIGVGDGGCDYAGRRALRRQQRRGQRPAHACSARSCASTATATSRPATRSPAPAPPGATHREHRPPARSARRRSPGDCATRSGSPSTRMPPAPASTSTTWARAPGRRSTSAQPAPTTAGTSAKATAPPAPPPTAGRRRRA